MNASMPRKVAELIRAEALGGSARWREVHGQDAWLMTRPDADQQVIWLPVEYVDGQPQSGLPVCQVTVELITSEPDHVTSNPAQVTAEQVDQWTRHLWHASQHNRMVIGLAGRLQQIAAEMREAAGLAEFGLDTAFPDAQFGQCSVHVEGCTGQETHG